MAETLLFHACRVFRRLGRCGLHDRAVVCVVLGIFGAWAILSGLLQLGTAVRRWKRFGAQWAMVLSGGQSALAGGFFIFQAAMPAVPSIANVAGYAAVGALYFLVSAVWLTVGTWRRSAAL